MHPSLLLISPIGRSGPVPINIVKDLALDVSNFLSKWEWLGRALGVEVERIKHDNSDIYEQCYKMFCHWLWKEGKGATFEILSKALERVNLQSISQTYCVEGHDQPWQPEKAGTSLRCMCDFWGAVLFRRMRGLEELRRG